MEFDNVVEAVEFLMGKFGDDYQKALNWIKRRTRRSVRRAMKALKVAGSYEYSHRLVAAVNGECDFWLDVQNELLDEMEES